MEDKPTGRPTDYSPALRDELCLRLASGRTLRSVCRDDDMPARSTIYEWVVKNIGEIKQGEKVLVQGFSDHLTRARIMGREEVHDEIIEIADDATNDYMEILKKKKDGGESSRIIFDKEAVMRSKLRVDARLTYLANMEPHKYGKNIKIESQALDKKGEPTDPPGSVAATDSFLEAMAAAVKKGEVKT